MTDIPKIPEIRIITEDLPQYKFPYAHVNMDAMFGYTLVQARSDEGVWLPRWCLVDVDGTALAIFEADSFDGLSAEIVAKAAAEALLEVHGLDESETGNKTKIAERCRSTDGDSFSFDLV